MAHKKDQAEKDQSSSTSRGQADPRKEKPALGNQTDMGDQTAQNVAGDQPAPSPSDTTQRKKQDPALAHSNSTSDRTSNSPYTTKAGRVDSGGVAGTKKREGEDSPGEPTTSQKPGSSDSNQ